MSGDLTGLCLFMNDFLELFFCYQSYAFSYQLVVLVVYSTTNVLVAYSATLVLVVYSTTNNTKMDYLPTGGSSGIFYHNWF